MLYVSFFYFVCFNMGVLSLQQLATSWAAFPVLAMCSLGRLAGEMPSACSSEREGGGRGQRAAGTGWHHEGRGDEEDRTQSLATWASEHSNQRQDLGHDQRAQLQQPLMCLS